MQPARQNHQPANQPKGHQISRKDLYMYPRKHFLGKKGRFWVKNPHFYGRKQKFWYSHNGKSPTHLVCIVFWSGTAPNGPKMPLLAQNNHKCILWAKFGRFWANNPNFYGRKQKFGIAIFVNRAYHQYTRGYVIFIFSYILYIWTTPHSEKIPVS